MSGVRWPMFSKCGKPSVRMVRTIMPKNQRGWSAHCQASGQDGRSGRLNPLRTIGDQIAEPLREHLGMSDAEARKVAAEWLDRVKFSDVARRMRQYPHELSGGMRQRVGIARVLTQDPAPLEEAVKNSG